MTEKKIDFQSTLLECLGFEPRVVQFDLPPRLEVLKVAAQEGRVLVTHDHKTMPRHFAQFIMRDTSPGLLVVPQHLAVVAAVEDLRLIWFATEAEEWVDRVSFLPL